MELRLLSALLRANENEQKEFYAKQIPRGIFKERKAEIRWIFDYRERNGRYPTVALFKSRFSGVSLVRCDETLVQATQALLDRDMFEQVSKAVDSGREMYQKGHDISEVISSLRTHFNDLRTYDTQFTDLDVADSRIALDRYKKRVLQKEAGGITHEPSPWKSFNALVGFMDWGEHTVMASRTSIGKTWLLLNWANHFRLAGERVLVISKEMPTHQIAERLEALMFKLPYGHFRLGCLSPRDLARWRILRNHKKVGHLIISGHDTIQGVGFGHIIAKIQQYRPSALFVDGAYLITPENLPRNASMVDRFSRISNMMKRICMAQRLIGFSVVQAGRTAENAKGETEVSLKELYGTDAWAQDADNVVLLSGLRGSSVRKIKLGKGRESAIGEFNISYQLDPYPYFGEAGGMSMSSQPGKVEFKTI